MLIYCEERKRAFINKKGRDFMKRRSELYSVHYQERERIGKRDKEAGKGRSTDVACHGRSFVLVALVDVRDRRLTTGIGIGIRLSPYCMFGVPSREMVTARD